MSSEGHVTALHSQISACDRQYSGQSCKRPAGKQWHSREIRWNAVHGFIATDLTVVVEGIS